MTQVHITDRDRFFNQVAVPRAWATDCWEWKGYSNPQTKYGQIASKREGGRTMTAPRFACFEFHGPPPEGAHVRHSCDNRLCASPYHVSWGTHSDNMRDAADRSPRQKGETHPGAKFTRDEVRTVVLDVVDYGVSRTVAADKHGVPYDTVCRWVQGRSRLCDTWDLLGLEEPRWDERS